MLAAFGNWKKAGQLLISAARKSPFVRRQLERSEMTAEQAASDPEAWARLAFVTKDDLMEDQRLAPPFGTRRTVPIEEIAMVVESSGTTAMGKEAHCVTREDYAQTLRTWGVSLRGMGITPSDIVAMTFPVGMSGGGVKHADAYVAVGAKMLRVANLSTRAKLDTMAYYGTTVLIATPFYVDRLGAVAAEAGIDVRSFKVRKIVVATQSVTCDWVQSTEERWGAKLHEWYGTAAGLIAFSCEHGMINERGERGTLHWDPDFAQYEILGADSGQWLQGGGRGELVGTPLVSSAEPLFRIRTRDEVTFRAPGTCRCGSRWPGIESGTVRRLDGMFKVKGVNVWPAHVEAILFSIDSIRDYRVRIVLDGQGRETMRMNVLTQTAEMVPEHLADHLSARLRRDTGLGFDVAVSEDPSQWLHETSGEAAKPRRWVDERMKERK
ncbi:MAG: phenylacetate-CoA ligase [Alphaproteobacteria bacterium]|jgi:phenylacetate-CoA ligase|nr:phenylacetate-CoA ligase [Alphaproteobacteria bacterium]